LQPKQPINIVKEVSSCPQTKMGPKLVPPIKNRCSLKQNPHLPEVSVVEHNNKHETTHESYEIINQLQQELGLLRSETGKIKVKAGEKINDHRTRAEVTEKDAEMEM
jgi:hypothetical protein